MKKAVEGQATPAQAADRNVVNGEPQSEGHKSPANPSELAWAGLLVKKAKWRLSWKGRAVIAIVVVVLGAFFVGNICAFLSMDRPAQGEYLIVEGWVPAYASREAKRRFVGGSYQKIFTCGSPVIDDFGAEARETYADWGARRLVKIGVDPAMVEAVSAPPPEKDRTYTSALSVKARLKERNISVTSIDVLTVGAHARRSQLLFQRAFGPQVKVGVISVSNPTYDAQHWWRSSAGVREVLGESIAYIYAKLFIQFSGE